MYKNFTEYLLIVVQILPTFIIRTYFVYELYVSTNLLNRMWHKVNFFMRSLTGLNSEFSFS